MTQNDFEFHVTQLVRQLDNLKSDIKRDIDRLEANLLNGIKTRDSYFNSTLDEHTDQLEGLKKTKWYAIGALGFIMIAFEIGMRAFDYWMVKSNGGG